MSDTSNGQEDAVGFDQTNGMVGGLEGESDGTAEGDLDPGGEREEDSERGVLGGGDTERAPVDPAPGGSFMQETGGEARPDDPDRRVDR